MEIVLAALTLPLALVVIPAFVFRNQLRRWRRPIIPARKFLRDTRGQNLAEAALLAAFAVSALVAFSLRAGLEKPSLGGLAIIGLLFLSAIALVCAVAHRIRNRNEKEEGGRDWPPYD